MGEAKLNEKLEADVRDPVVAFSKSLGIIHIRMHFGGGAAVGYPDDLFLFPNGVSLWVEFKRPGKEAEPIQKYRQKLLMDLGHPALTVDDAEEGKEVIRTFMGAALAIVADTPNQPADDSEKDYFHDADQRGLMNDGDA